MAEVKGSLKDSIPREDSDKPTLRYFNRHVRPLIAARWEDVAVQLLSEEHQKEINIIKANHHGDVEKCCSSLFTIWSQRQPEGVTWRALIEAIRNAHFTNEANQIEKMLMTSTDHPGTPSSQLDTLLSPSSPRDLQLVHVKCVINKLDEEVQREYAHYMTELLNLLSKLLVSKDDILFMFSSLEGHSAVTREMRLATNLQSFMLALTSSQSWYNFATTATLACTFGGNEGRKLVESYEQKLKVHLLKRITCKLPEDIKTEAIEVKFDEKKEHFTEEKVIKFRNTLAKCLKLEPEDFVFLSVESGCVKLTFLFLSRHVPCIKHNIASGTDDLIQCNVLSVIIRGEVIWQRKISRHIKRSHDDTVTKPKRPRTLSTPSYDTTNQNNSTTVTYVPPHSVMRSLHFSPSQTNHGQQSITYTVSLYRIICSTTRKRIITMATILVILFIFLYLYYSKFSSKSL